MEGRQHNQCRTTYYCTYLSCINRKITLYVLRAPRSHQVNSFLIHLPIIALGWVEPEYDIQDLLNSPYVILHKKTNRIVDVLFIKHKSNFNKACLPSSMYSSGLHCLFLSSSLVVSFLYNSWNLPLFPAPLPKQLSYRALCYRFYFWFLYNWRQWYHIGTRVPNLVNGIWFWKICKGIWAIYKGRNICKKKNNYLH